MDTRVLFWHTLRDLAQRISTPDEYALLRASSLLRQLLVDDAPLWATVNRHYRLKVVFPVGIVPASAAPPGALFWTAPGGYDLERLPESGVQRQELSDGDFLSLTLVIWQHVSFSVRDVIDIEANVSGGVHAGPPKNEKADVLHSLNQTSFVMGVPIARQFVAPLGRIVLRAMEPLYDAVGNDLGTITDERRQRMANGLPPFSYNPEALAVLDRVARSGEQPSRKKPPFRKSTPKNKI